jgi:antitoxin (DNA-binding transcriptional repressor) of toxin-antitoxin stability system
MRELGPQAARLIGEIQKAGRPVIITSHGRFVATITPLVPGQVESQVLPEMARQIGRARLELAPAPGVSTAAGAASR